jgi:DNA-binding XRE family transcriptional regulator
MAREEPVKYAIEKGRADAGNVVMKTCYTMAASGKHPVMTIFWLKTRCRWREAESFGNPNSAKNLTLNYKLDDDEN